MGKFLLYVFLFIASIILIIYGYTRERIYQTVINYDSTLLVKAEEPKQFIPPPVKQIAVVKEDMVKRTLKPVKVEKNTFYYDKATIKKIMDTLPEPSKEVVIAVDTAELPVAKKETISDSVVGIIPPAKKTRRRFLFF